MCACPRCTCVQVLWTVTVEGLSSSNARTSYRPPELSGVGIARAFDGPANFSDTARNTLATAGGGYLVLVSPIHVLLS